MTPLLEFVRHLRATWSPAVVASWLQEFGYAPDGADQHVALTNAARERGPRLERELSTHAARLGHRAQMQSARMYARAGVLR